MLICFSLTNKKTCNFVTGVLNVNTRPWGYRLYQEFASIDYKKISIPYNLHKF